MLSRTYLPSQISRAVRLWREDLRQVSDRAAAALADPAEYPNLFPDLDWALKVEEVFKCNRNKVVPAMEYLTAKDDLDLDLVALMKQEHADDSLGGKSPIRAPISSIKKHETDSSINQDLPSEANDDGANDHDTPTLKCSVDDEANAILQNDFDNDDDDDDW